MNKRFVSIYLPHLPIERLRRLKAPERQSTPAAAMAKKQPPAAPRRPFALVAQNAKGLRLTALNQPARALGLRPQMALADALTLAPDLRTRPAEPAADRRELLRLAHWCGRYGPASNAYQRDGIWIDVSGASHLFGGEAALLRRIGSDFFGLGYEARTGLADSFAAAFALSRFLTPQAPPASPENHADERIAPPGREPAAAHLAALPVEALRLAPQTATRLRQLGLRTIGQLTQLPRSALQRRFASGAGIDAVLLRLDQLLGRRDEPLAALHPPPRFSLHQTFAEALVSPRQIESVLPALLQRLIDQLQQKQRGVRRLSLTLWRMDGSAARLQVGSSKASRDQPHLLRLLGEKLARIEPGFGIDIVTLAAERTEALPAGQGDLAAPSRTRRSDASRLLDRLANRLGEASIYGLRPLPRHQPERAQQAVSACLEPAAAERLELSPPGPRPLLLLQPPEAITVMAPLPDEPPLSFTWRKVRRRVAASDGPERIAAEWGCELGRRQSRPRDYYRVECEEGGLFWLYREGLYEETATPPPRWFMHGLFT